MQTSEPGARAPAPLDHNGPTVFDRMLREREREADLLRIEAERWRREAAAAQGQLAFLQLTMQRHIQHRTRDEAEVQRLLAEVAEATAQRKEQAAVIQRREARILELQALLEGNGSQAAPAGVSRTPWSRLKRWWRRQHGRSA